MSGDEFAEEGKRVWEFPSPVKPSKDEVLPASDGDPSEMNDSGGDDTTQSFHDSESDRSSADEDTQRPRIGLTEAECMCYVVCRDICTTI